MNIDSNDSSDSNNKKKKIIWLSDIHLDHLSDTDNKVILNHVCRKASSGDTVVISGDIATAHGISTFMNSWRTALSANGADLKFVLGNHDYYNGSIANIRNSMVKNFPNNWLGNCGPIFLTDKTAIVGHDGWYDGLYADYYLSRLDMNDYYLIKELSRLPPTLLTETADRHKKIQDLATISANHVFANGDKALSVGDCSTLFIVTHVPAWEGAAWFKGAPSNGDWMPHFSSKIMGDAIVKLGRKYPTKQIIVLCGHTHVGEKNNRDYMQENNIRSITASAQYGLPCISDIFEVE